MLIEKYIQEVACAIKTYLITPSINNWSPSFSVCDLDLIVSSAHIPSDFCKQKEITVAVQGSLEGNGRMEGKCGVSLGTEGLKKCSFPTLVTATVSR